MPSTRSPSDAAPSVELPDFVPPRFDLHPEAAYTLGPEVVEICNLAGYRPDVHQQLLLDRLFAYDDTDRLVSPEAAILCSRQNLKSSGLKMAALGWLFVDNVELIVWSAHELGTAKEMFRDLRNLIMATPALRVRLKPSRNEGINEANGNIAIELAPSKDCPNGQRILFKARTLDGGRGLSGDRVVLDEAFALQPDHMAAIMPTLSARPNPQLIYASSACKANSNVLREVVKRGRAGTSELLTFLEWCSWRDSGSCKRVDCTHAVGSPGCVLDDQAELVHSNPSLAVWRELPGGTRQQGLQPSILAMERESMPPAEYARERLGWHDDPIEGDPILPADAWEKCAAEPATFEPVVAVDVSPARTWSCIGAAGPVTDDRWAVEVTSSAGQPDYREGTAWVVPRLAAMRARLPGMRVALAAGSAAESLTPELDRAGVPYDLITTRDVQAACGLFVDLAVDHKISHFSQPTLTGALTAARLKNTEAGFRWERRRSAGDISPLYAVTLALWQAKQVEQSKAIPQFWNFNDL